MPKQPADYLKEARRIAAAAGLYFVEKDTVYKVYRKTTMRPVFIGSRASAASLCSLVKRCATAK